MNRFYLISFILFFFLDLTAQKYDYNWVLGDYYEGNGFNILNFETNPPNITTRNAKMYFGYTTLTMSDIDGKLIFYSNGLDINNRDNVKMKNSASFNFSMYPYIREAMGNNFHCVDLFTTMKTIPQPGSNHKYLIFHQSWAYDSLNVIPYPVLHFTIIDMDGDNGLGEVTYKNILLRENIDGVAFTRHPNGKDWWMVISDYLSNRYYTYIIDSTGISIPKEQIVGTEIFYSFYNKYRYPASINFSPDGTKLIRNKQNLGFFILDFNRNNGAITQRFFNRGEFSNLMTFSPDSRYIYLRKYVDYRILQYDIENNKIYPVSFFYNWDYLLAPDNKVYFECGLDNYLCFINRPDLLGEACDPHYNAIKLKKYFISTFPQFPNYRLKNANGQNTEFIKPENYIYRFDHPSQSIDPKYTKRIFTQKEIDILKNTFGEQENFINSFTEFKSIQNNRLNTIKK